jgi:acetyltransferase-like isoleucine patch superfamily enzyme
MLGILKKALRSIVVFPLKKLDFIDVYSARSFFNNHPIIFGDPDRIKIGKSVHLYNAILNTNSGRIIIEDYATIKPNSMLITGTHDFSKKNLERRDAYPRNGHDIIIKKGAWVGPGAIVLGNVTIGENAVIGAGSIVTKSVEANCIAAGNPAKVIKRLSEGSSSDSRQESTRTVE